MLDVSVLTRKLTNQEGQNRVGNIVLGLGKKMEGDHIFVKGWGIKWKAPSPCHSALAKSLLLRKCYGRVECRSAFTFISENKQ